MPINIFLQRGGGELSDQTKRSRFLTNDPLLSILWKNQDEKSWSKCTNGSTFGYEILEENNLKNPPIDIESFNSIKEDKFILGFDLLYLRNESDIKLLLENNHKIEIDYREYSLMGTQFETVMKLLEKSNELKWETIFSKIFKSKYGNDNYSMEFVKHLLLLNLTRMIIDKKLCNEILNQSYEYEKDLRKKFDDSKYSEILNYKEFYNRILKDLNQAPLKLEESTKNRLTFSSLGFLGEMSRIIQDNKESMTKMLNSYDLMRLVFKWILSMENKFRDDFSTFKELIKADYEILKEYFPPSFRDIQISDFYIESKKVNSISYNQLIQFEFMERGHEAIDHFNNALKCLYEEKDCSCEEIRKDPFFKNVEKDIVSKNTILRFDVNESLMICLMTGKHEYKESKNKLELVSFKELSGPNYGFISKKLLDIYKDGKKESDNEEMYPRLLVKDINDFKNYLKLLERLGELDLDTMKILFGFGSDNKWDEKKFEEFEKQLKEESPSDPFFENIKKFEFIE